MMDSPNSCTSPTGIASTSARAPRSPARRDASSDEALIDRLPLRLIVEACRVLDEGVAAMKASTSPPPRELGFHPARSLVQKGWGSVTSSPVSSTDR